MTNSGFVKNMQKLVGIATVVFVCNKYFYPVVFNYIIFVLVSCMILSTVTDSLALL